MITNQNIIFGQNNSNKEPAKIFATTIELKESINLSKHENFQVKDKKSSNFNFVLINPNEFFQNHNLTQHLKFAKLIKKGVAIRKLGKNIFLGFAVHFFEVLSCKYL